MLSVRTWINTTRYIIKYRTNLPVRGLSLGRSAVMEKFFQRIGAYPPEYKPHIHGPYDPAINYKPDTPFKDVKLGELGKWLQRRNPNPIPAISRAYWKYCQTWLMPKRASAAGLIQVILGASLFYYVMSYNTLKYHRHCKYH